MFAEDLFPGEAVQIPWNDGTGWGVDLSAPPSGCVKHGAGYGRFVQFVADHSADATVLSADARALFQFLAVHAAALADDAALARSADVFLGNCLNFAFEMEWIGSPDLAIAGDRSSVTIEGMALLLATNRTITSRCSLSSKKQRDPTRHRGRRRRRCQQAHCVVVGQNGGFSG